MVRVRRVGRRVERGVDLAQEQPGAEGPRHQVGVLALPTKTGGLGQRLFHDRRGIDEDFDVAPADVRDDELGQRLERAFDDVVVIPVAGIDRNRRPVGAAERGERVGIGRVGGRGR